MQQQLSENWNNNCLLKQLSYLRVNLSYVSPYLLRPGTLLLVENRPPRSLPFFSKKSAKQNKKCQNVSYSKKSSNQVGNMPLSTVEYSQSAILILRSKKIVSKVLFPFFYIPHFWKCNTKQMPKDRSPKAVKATST